ncbi:MAG TPA: carboxypeptidase regulatory-like domain-containing protein [Anaeromyxobacter sp.]|nr:carboxypeptidase regulatory-like domain-containing protein [Anaeromyxobacter sp.]
MKRARLAALAVPALVALLAIALLLRESPPAPAPPPAEPAVEVPPSPALPVRPGVQRFEPLRDLTPGTFEGRVLSAATAAPIPGAELTFSRGGVAASVQAGPDGVFHFQPPAAGRWLLATASAPGHFPFAPEWGFSPVQLDAAPGKHVRGLEVFLAPATEIDGLLVDEDGAPVPGAEVLLRGAGGGKAVLITIPGRWVTDARGTFRAAAPQNSVLEARKQGYYPGHARVDLHAVVDGRIRITLGAAWAGPEPQKAALAGQVVGPDGQPIPGALVEAGRTHGWAYAGTPVAQALTDADGRFRIDELDRSPHLLRARAEGYQPGEVGRVIPGGPEVKMTLAGGGRLRGCVRDATTAAPVAPYTVNAFFSSNGWRDDPDVQLSVADPSGCFTMNELEVGESMLVVLAPGRAPSDPVRVNVPPPPASGEVEVTLAAGGTLRGLVRDEVTGAPLASAHVAAEAVPVELIDVIPPNTVIGETTTALDGTFTLRGLPAQVRVVVNAAGHHTSSSRVVPVAPGDESGSITVDLRPQQEGDVGPVQPVGIGAVLQPQGDEIVVGGFRPGAPAASGLVPGDQLLEIDGRPVSQLGPGGAVEAIRGPEGTSVFLLVRRGNGTVDVEVPRRRMR